MRSAKTVVISRGPWPDGGKADAVEALFDDGTELVIHFGVEQVDRLLPNTDAGQPAAGGIRLSLGRHDRSFP